MPGRMFQEEQRQESPGAAKAKAKRKSESEKVRNLPPLSTQHTHSLSPPPPPPPPAQPLIYTSTPYALYLLDIIFFNAFCSLLLLITSTTLFPAIINHSPSLRPSRSSPGYACYSRRPVVPATALGQLLSSHLSSCLFRFAS